MTKATLVVVSSAILCIFGTAVFIRKRRSKYSYRGPWLSELPDGPKPSSWAAGNLKDIFINDNLGDIDQEFVKKFGLAFKIKYIFGSDMLYLADPQALHYILDTRAYTFHREDTAKTNQMMFGPNLVGTEGFEHARQRRVLTPGFQQSSMNDIIPVFLQLVDKWNDLVEPDSWSVVDVHAWLSRTTLDAVGYGVFSYDFGALGDSPSDFIKYYRKVFVEKHIKPTAPQITFGLLLGLLPMWFLRGISSLLGDKEFKEFLKTGRKIASDIVERELQAAAGGVPQGNAIMSIMTRANLEEDPKQRMTKEVLLSQTIILTIAGHETTSSTLTWILLQLARHPTVQSKLRKEISEFRATVGNRDLNASDIDSRLPYTTAVIKETLRYYPVAPYIIRRASCDDTIPLSRPIKTSSGKMRDEVVSIRAGQPLLISLWGYNRVKDIWGEDADEWKPDRFLDGKLDKHTLGVYANLATFSSGVHGCIGWRFAILELHSILVTLIEKFEFGPSLDDHSIMRVGIVTMIPMIKGQEDRGAQLPLMVRPVSG